MIDTIIQTIQTIANTKVVLDAASAVSQYIWRKLLYDAPDEMMKGVISYAEREQALEATLKEWEHIAAIVEPAIGDEMNRNRSSPLINRAEALAKLAREYGTLGVNSYPWQLDNVLLKHTAFQVTNDGSLRLRFGQSKETKYLEGENVKIPGAIDANSRITNQASQKDGNKMQLPIFKVTMLGDSGVGKTVFMSSMYAKLRHGQHGIAIRAISNDVDLELEQNIAEVYTLKNWPPGTDVNEKRYEFELLLRGKAVARIDWVDYRGGALSESETKEGGSTLIKRLRESHSIIWMIDMSRLSSGTASSFSARLTTKVGRMAQLCRQAATGKNDLRSILFVRTKSDEVLDASGKPDWGEACDQLLRHLGSDNFGDIPCAAAIPVSSVGRLGGDKAPVGDDPYNVEWPLLLSLAFMLEIDLKGLTQAAEQAHQQIAINRSSKVREFFREVIFNTELNEAQVEALKNSSRLSQQVIGMRDVIAELVRHRPLSIRMF